MLVFQSNNILIMNKIKNITTNTRDRKGDMGTELHTVWRSSFLSRVHWMTLPSLLTLKKTKLSSKSSFCHDTCQTGSLCLPPLLLLLLKTGWSVFAYPQQVKKKFRVVLVKNIPGYYTPTRHRHKARQQSWTDVADGYEQTWLRFPSGRWIRETMGFWG